MSQKGFSLVEVLAATGMAGILALTMTKLHMNNMKGQKTAETSSNISDLTNRARTVLSYGENCKQLVDGVVFIQNSSPVETPAFGLQPSGSIYQITPNSTNIVPILNKNKVYLNVKFEGTRVQRTAPDELTFFLDFYREKQEGKRTTFGANRVTKKIVISAEFDSENKVNRCDGVKENAIVAKAKEEICLTLGGIWVHLENRCKSLYLESAEGAGPVLTLKDFNNQEALNVEGISKLSETHINGNTFITGETTIKGLTSIEGATNVTDGIFSASDGAQFGDNIAVGFCPHGVCPAPTSSIQVAPSSERMGFNFGSEQALAIEKSGRLQITEKICKGDDCIDISCNVGEILIKTASGWKCQLASCLNSKDNSQQYLAGFDPTTGSPLCNPLIDGAGELCPEGSNLSIQPNGNVKLNCCQKDCSNASNYCVGTTNRAANNCGYCPGTNQGEEIATLEVRDVYLASCSRSCGVGNLPTERKYDRVCDNVTLSSLWKTEGARTCGTSCYPETINHTVSSVSAAHKAVRKCSGDKVLTGFFAWSNWSEWYKHHTFNQIRCSNVRENQDNNNMIKNFSYKTSACHDVYINTRYQSVSCHSNRAINEISVNNLWTGDEWHKHQFIDRIKCCDLQDAQITMTACYETAINSNNFAAYCNDGYVLTGIKVGSWYWDEWQKHQSIDSYTCCKIKAD